MKILLLGGEADGRKYHVQDERPYLRVAVLDGPHNRVLAKAEPPVGAIKTVDYRASRRLSTRKLMVFLAAGLDPDGDKATELLQSKALAGSTVPTDATIVGVRIHLEQGEDQRHTEYALQQIQRMAKDTTVWGMEPAKV